MYLFVSILCLGLISYSAAGPLNGKCPNVPAKKNFQPKEYFKGNWYFSHFYSPKSLKKEFSVCVKSEVEILPNNIARETSVIYYKHFKSFSFLEDFVNINQRTDGEAKYNVELRYTDMYGKPLTGFYDIPVTIIATDYENYTIGYSCLYKTGEHIEAYAIYKRNETEELDSDVEVILNELGLKLEDFQSNKCKYDEE